MMEKYELRSRKARHESSLKKLYKKSGNCLQDSPHINCDTEVQESQKSVMEKYNLRSRKARDGSSLKKIYKNPGNCLEDSQDINCNTELHESQKSMMEKCNLRSCKTRIRSSLKKVYKKPGNCLQDSQNINCDIDVKESNISFQIMSEYESKKVERPFKCRICETAFTRKDHLRTHEKRHTGDYKKKCEICFKTYSNLFNLKQHMSTIHNGTTKYKCELCLREFTNKSSLTYHTRAQHSKENIIYSCALCSKTFFSPAQVRKHSKMHNGRNHTCTICGLAFSKLSALRSHKAAIHIPFVGPRLYHSSNENAKMDIFLDNGSEFPESLGIDRVIKEEKIDYNSMSCDEYGLPKTESEIDIDKCQAIETNFSNSIRCTICEKILVSEQSHMIHMRIHNGDMPYKCDKCPKSFSLASILKIHKRTHKKRECDICGKKLSHSNALKAHMRLHTGERPFKCNICTRAFTTTSFLKYHKNSEHTGERNYTCTICEKSFFSKSHLTQHSLSHNQIKGIICEICGTVFLKRTYMVQHKIDVHNISSVGTYSVKHRPRSNANLKRTTCGICEKTLKVNTIRTHILIKHPDRVKCECNHCGHYFDTIDALVVHQKTDCLKCVGTNQEEQEFSARESSVA